MEPQEPLSCFLKVREFEDISKMLWTVLGSVVPSLEFGSGGKRSAVSVQGGDTSAALTASGYRRPGSAGPDIRATLTTRCTQAPRPQVYTCVAANEEDCNKQGSAPAPSLLMPAQPSQDKGHSHGNHKNSAGGAGPARLLMLGARVRTPALEGR
ncbi:unnamed protein product [Gadus morhua 'NCC']